MAVDLGDLVDSLKREVNPLGGNAFPDATDDDYFGYLEDAFWEARLDGITILASFNELDGLVTAKAAGGDEITRDLQQLIVLYGGIRIIRNQLTNLNTAFRAEAGPAQFEIQKSAQVLKGILDELRMRRDFLLLRLSDMGRAPAFVIDAVAAREQSIGWGDTFWSGA